MFFFETKSYDRVGWQHWICFWTTTLVGVFNVTTLASARKKIWEWSTNLGYWTYARFWSSTKPIGLWNLLLFVSFETAGNGLAIWHILRIWLRTNNHKHAVVFQTYQKCIVVEAAQMLKKVTYHGRVRSSCVDSNFREIEMSLRLTVICDTTEGANCQQCSHCKTKVVNR